MGRGPSINIRRILGAGDFGSLVTWLIHWVCYVGCNINGQKIVGMWLPNQMFNFFEMWHIGHFIVANAGNNGSALGFVSLL